MLVAPVSGELTLGNSDSEGNVLVHVARAPLAGGYFATRVRRIGRGGALQEASAECEGVCEGCDDAASGRDESQ